MSRLTNITETASELGKEASESVKELGRSAAWTLNEARGETGGALHTAAATVRATGQQGSEAIEHLARGTADRLDAAAAYVEKHDVNTAIAGLRRFGLRHLAASVVAAAAVGFLAESAVGRATNSCGKRA